MKRASKQVHPAPAIDDLDRVELAVLNSATLSQDLVEERLLVLLSNAVEAPAAALDLDAELPVR